MRAAMVMVGWDVAAVASLVALVATVLAVWLWALGRRRRRMLGELHESREQYRALASNLPDISVLVFDQDLRFTLVEGGALEAHGWKREEILGRRPDDVLPREYAGPLMPHFANAMRGVESSISTVGARGGHYTTDF